MSGAIKAKEEPRQGMAEPQLSFSAMNVNIWVTVRSIAPKCGVSGHFWPLLGFTSRHRCMRFSCYSRLESPAVPAPINLCLASVARLRRDTHWQCGLRLSSQSLSLVLAVTEQLRWRRASVGATSPTVSGGSGSSCFALMP